MRVFLLLLCCFFAFPQLSYSESGQKEIENFLNQYAQIVAANIALCGDSGDKDIGLITGAIVSNFSDQRMVEYLNTVFVGKLAGHTADALRDVKATQRARVGDAWLTPTQCPEIRKALDGANSAFVR